MDSKIKVSDMVAGLVTAEGSQLWDGYGLFGKIYGPLGCAEFVADVLNSHDALVEEVERLRGIIASLKEHDYDEDVPCYYDHLEASAWCSGYVACIEHIQHLVKEGKKNE